MSSVSKVWNDETHFCANLTGAGWGIILTFPINELSSGASLSRMMTIKVRETLQASPGLVPEEELKSAAKEAKLLLRDIIEPYFEARGIGGY